MERAAVGTPLRSLVHFLKKFGSCKFGDKCYFKHDSAEPKAKAKSAPNPKPAAKPKASPSTSTSTTTVGAQAVCQMWSKTGKCRFGDKCKFKHDGKPAAKQASASSSQAQAPLVGAQPNPKASAGRVKSHVAMARSSEYTDSAEADEESSVAPSSTEEEMPMHAEASTPEWSDVEQGLYPDQESSVAESSDTEQEQPQGVAAYVSDVRGPLWVLDLSVRDYVAWTHRRTEQYVDDEGRGPPELQSYAESVFYAEPNPRSVTWAVWFTIIHDRLDEDESGVIPVADGVDMIKLDTALVQCVDGIPRPVSIAWVVDLETGHERRFAVARITQQPIVSEWPRPQPSVAAPPKAEKPSVPWAEMRATSWAVPHVTQAHHPPVNTCLHRRPASAQQTAETHQRSQAAAAVGSALGHAGEDDLVLADTGANEVIRPTGNGPPPRSSSVSLTLADGNEVEAWRTRDGELAIPGSDAWIAPIGKIVALGYRFTWDPCTGAQLKREDGDDVMTYHLCVENGLPYLAWSDFVEIRKQLSQVHKVWKRSMCAHVESPAEPRYVTLEDFVACEAEYRAQEEPVGHIGERIAEQILCKDHISYDDVLEAILKSNLEPQRKRRSCIDTSDGKVECWVFGAFNVGSKVGVTQRTKERPLLTRLVNRFMQQENPGMSWSSFTISKDITFAPHRDLGNESDTQNILVVLNHQRSCRGGELWVENPNGDETREVGKHKSLKGMLHPTQRTPVIFSPKLWH